MPARAKLSAVSPIPAPAGDVTFVFTDIVQSTALMRRIGESAYKDVLDEHRSVLRETWEHWRGFEVGTEGDSFLVAFGDSADAVNACLDGHELLAASEALAAAGLQIRTGMHRGTAYPQAGEYVSLAVHRAARIAAGAHGRQTLLSPAAAAAAMRSGSVEIESLGKFRVRDFKGATEVFAAFRSPGQVGPTPNLVPDAGHNLPATVGKLIGRDSELEALTRLVAPGRVATVVGPGGVGKTRLAVEAGRAIVDVWHDGVVFIDLSAVSDGSQLGVVLADEIGCPLPTSSPWDDAIDFLESRRSVLILDNCEHLFPDSSVLAARIAQQCPGVAVLATSRERLGVTAERTLVLEPLPTRGAGPGEDLAADLFRARLGSPPDDADDVAIAEVCELVDGLPLAIEIAAAQVGPVPVRDVRDLLRASTSELVSTSPDIPDRHRSLDAVLNWSYALLSDAEMRVLRRTSVLAGTFTVEAAQVAAASQEVQPDAVRGHLWALASKSLVAVERGGEETRYRLLQTVRDHVSGRGKEQELVTARRNVGMWLLERVGPAARLDVDGFAELGLEIDNLRSLIHQPAGLDVSDRQRLAWSVGRHYDVTDRFRLGAAEMTAYVKELAAETPDRVALLTLEADLRMRFGDAEAARALVEEASLLAERVGLSEWDDGGLDRARGALALWDGDFERARQIALGGLSGDASQRGRARLFDLLGVAEGQLGNFEAAAAALQQELVLWEQLGLDSYAATTLGNMAEAYLGLDRYVDAASCQLRCLDLAAQLDQPVLVAFSLILAAHVAAKDERWIDAVSLQGAADAALADAEYALYAADLEARDELIQQASEYQRAEQVAELLSDEGRMPLSVAMDLAREILGSVPVGG